MRWLQLARWPGLVAAALTVAACASQPPLRPSLPTGPVNYYVRIVQPGAERFDVSLAIDEVRSDSIDFYLPVWTPGLYMRRTPAVQNFSVREGHGRPIAVRRLERHRWRLYPQGARYITIGYQVPNHDSDHGRAFATILRLEGGYTLGSALFGTLEGHEARPVTVAFDLPRGWRVATPLREIGARRFAASSFHLLPGTAFALGDRMLEYKLFVANRPHQVVIQGAPRGFAPDSLLKLISEAIDHGTRFYGVPPYERYLLAIHFEPPGTTGLGATGQAASGAFFLPPIDSDRMRQAGIAQLILHQYLHAWYPGAFGPTSLLNPDFSRPSRVPELWLVEGAAEYFARLLPVRHGLEPRASFYAAMGNLLTVWRETGGRNRIDPASLVPSGSGSDARLVVGGALSAFVIDIALRGDTRGQRGLDDLLAYLQRGTPVGGYGSDVWLEAAAALEVPLDALVPLVNGSPLSIEAGLARAGLRVTERVESHQTLGARLVVEDSVQERVDPQQQAIAREFGIPYRPAEHFVLRDITPGGTAASAGLVEGDVLLRINNTPVGPNESIATRYALRRYIQESPPGARITFNILRGGTPLERTGSVRRTRIRRAAVEEIPGVSAAALVIRTSLLSLSSASSGR